MSVIKLHRNVGYADRFREYSIEIDSHKVGEIKAGETKEIPVAEGSHVVQLKIDWCCSNKLQVNVSSGKNVSLECGNITQGWRLILAVLYVTIWCKKYLWIRKIR